VKNVCAVGKKKKKRKEKKKGGCFAVLSTSFEQWHPVRTDPHPLRQRKFAAEAVGADDPRVVGIFKTDAAIGWRLVA